MSPDLSHIGGEKPAGALTIGDGPNQVKSLASVTEEGVRKRARDQMEEIYGTAHFNLFQFVFEAFKRSLKEAVDGSSEGIGSS